MWEITFHCCLKMFCDLASILVTKTMQNQLSLTSQEYEGVQKVLASNLAIT